MDQLEQAVKLIRSGDEETARTVLLNTLKANPQNLDAWFWMAAVVKSKKKRYQCLQEILKRDPDNEVARRALASLDQPPAARPQAQPEPEPEPIVIPETPALTFDGAPASEPPPQGAKPSPLDGLYSVGAPSTSSAAAAAKPKGGSRAPVVLALLFLIAAVIFALLYVLGQGAIAIPFLSPAPTPDPWRQLTSEEGRFSVLIPGNPVEEMQTIDSSAGPVSQYLFSVQKAGNELYVCAYNDFPDYIVDDYQVAFDAGRDGILRGTEGQIVDEQDLDIDGHPGRALTITRTIEGVEARQQVHFYLVENRLYQLLVIMPADRFASADAAKFFDSFTLLPESSE